MFDEIQPRSVDSASLDAVRRSYVDGPTPVRLIEPAGDDVDLLHWSAAHTDDLLSELSRAGAVLFRGFGVDTIDSLRRFAQTFSPDLIPYTERRSPRTELGDKVYTSTIHPADQYIHFHNTTSFSHQWPRKLWFNCIQPAEWEGRTPLADCRKVLADMDPEVAAEFKAKGVLYVSNYHEGSASPGRPPSRPRTAARSSPTAPARTSSSNGSTAAAAAHQVTPARGGRPPRHG